MPSLQYSIIMHKVGGIVIAPMSKTMLGCRYLDRIEIYVLNSLSNYSLMLGLKIFLTATYIPQYLPLWIVLKPPIDICSPIYKSYNFISNTPFLNYGIGSFYFSSTTIFLLVRSVFRLTFISLRYIFYYHCVSIVGFYFRFFVLPSINHSGV